MKWPADQENREYYAFWRDRAVEIGQEAITIRRRKVLPVTGPEQVIPDYVWENAEMLYWDRDTGSFMTLN